MAEGAATVDLDDSTCGSSFNCCASVFVPTELREILARLEGLEQLLERDAFAFLGNLVFLFEDPEICELVSIDCSSLEQLRLEVEASSG